VPVVNLQTQQKPTKGFTLVEAVITIAIMSIALLAISQALAFGLKHSSDGISQARIVNLAQAYFEEISAKRFAEATPTGGVPACSGSTTPCGVIGPESGESRATYDDVDDFDGLLDSPPRDALGNVRAGYESYSVAIDVRYLLGAEVSATGADDTTDAKRVALEIQAPGQTPQKFVTVYGNF